MPFPALQPPSPEMNTSDLSNFLIGLIRNLNWLLSELDDLNVNNITAKSIKVSQLSAIAADLGTITAGTVTGATLRTAASGARIQMSGNSLSTYNSDNLSQGPSWGDTFGANFGDMGFFDAGFQTLLLKCLGNKTGYQIQADSGANLNLGATGTNTYTYGDWDMQGTFKVKSGSQFDTISQADSTATDITTLVADFNTLLANLRLLNILA